MSKNSEVYQDIQSKIVCMKIILDWPKHCHYGHTFHSTLQLAEWCKYTMDQRIIMQCKKSLVI
jgi:uncharacterized protein YydD (DUF2326 family)